MRAHIFLAIVAVSVIAGCAGPQAASRDELQSLRSRVEMDEINVRDIEQGVDGRAKRLSDRLDVLENIVPLADLERELVVLKGLIYHAIDNGNAAAAEELIVRQSYLTELVVKLRERPKR